MFSCVKKDKPDETEGLPPGIEDTSGDSLSGGVSLMSAVKRPIVTSLAATVTLATDTTLRVITKWGYKTAPPVFPDSTRVKVGVGASPPSTEKGHFVKWPQTTDTSFVPVAGYGTIQGYSCVVPHRGTTWGGQTCTNWQFVRAEPQIPPFDSLSAQVASIIVMPNGIQVDFDSNATNGAGTCKRWQTNNPTANPWIAVNIQAVARCTGVNGKPIIAQFCAFAKMKDSTIIATVNSKDVPYCNELLTELRATRQI